MELQGVLPWRRWPLLLPAVGCTLGIAAARSEALSLAQTQALFIAALLLGLIPAARRLLLPLAFGMLWGGLFLLLDARQVAVAPDWFEERLVIEGRLLAVEASEGGQKMLLDAVTRRDGAALSGQVRLHLYRPLPWLQCGQRIALVAQLHPPQNHANPGGFDLRSFAFDRHIALYGSAIGAVRLLRDEASLVQRGQRKIRTALAQLPPREGGIVASLLLGETGTIPDELNDAFAATGTAHLLAISGFNVGMVALWGFALCWWLLTRRAGWIVALPVRRLALLVGLLAATFYTALAGWPLPAQRALWMVAAAVVAWWSRVRAEPVNTLLAALLLILLLDPAAVDSPSLWLSFAATLSLLLWAGSPDANRRWWHWPRQLLWISLLAMAITLPLILHLFGRLPLYGLPANLLLEPLHALWVMPLALAGEIVLLLGGEGAAALLFQLCAFGAALGNDAVLAIAALPHARLWTPPPLPLFDALYFSALLGFAWLHYRGRLRLALATLCAALLLYGAAAMQQRPPHAPMLIFWDAGQGSALSLLTPDGGVLAVDAPGPLEERFNGGSLVAEGLRHLGMTHIDLLVASHLQADHAGGLPRLIELSGQVGVLLLPALDETAAKSGSELAANLRQRAAAAGSEVRQLVRDDRLLLGKGAHAVPIEVLWPPRGFRPKKANDGSLVLSLALPGGRALLTGDIERAAEAALMARGIGSYRLLVVPHHGSKSSSTPAFVAAVSPRLAVVQSGRHNRFGFPRPEIVARYRAAGAEIWNSADGAILLTVAADGGWQLRQWPPPPLAKREAALAFWQGAGMPNW